jgi:hypothetical protein
MLQNVAKEGRGMSEREKESGTLTDRKRQLEQHVLRVFHSVQTWPLLAAHITIAD